jgi:hypothetical protein
MDGATNGARFRAYLSDVPVPALNPGEGGDGQPGRPQGEGRAAMPAYSPDLNPIENAF